MVFLENSNAIIEVLEEIHTERQIKLRIAQTGVAGFRVAPVKAARYRFVLEPT
jgi:hypothetical protein